MKKYFLLPIIFCLCIAGTFLLTSEQTAVQMYKKCVFPINQTIDKAFSKTELNGFLRGDSATGYEIWGRNRVGTYFPLAQPYELKEYYTDQENLSVGDTAAAFPFFATVSIYKSFFTTNKMKFNTFDIVGKLYDDANMYLIFFVLDSNRTVIYRDTLDNLLGNDINIKYYSFELDSTITLEANDRYSIGLYANGADACEFIGNSFYPYTSGTPKDSTWLRASAPVLGNKLAPTETIQRTLNFKVYYKE
jgi:hypothetical protein